MALAFLLLFCSSVSAEKRKKREVQPVKLTLPLYYQTDYDQPIFTWKDRAITVAESGCGATCVSMVIGYFEPHREPEPDEIMRLAGEMGFYRGDGLGRDALRLLLAEYGIEGRWRALDARAIENTLRKGRPIIEYVGPGYFTGSGHYVVLRGIAANGELLGRRSEQRRKHAAQDLSLRGDAQAGEGRLSVHDLRSNRRAGGSDGRRDKAITSAVRQIRTAL